MTFNGYVRPDGSVGVRNHVIVVPTVMCVNHVARKIADRADGAAALLHGSGCTVGDDLEQTFRVLANLGSHPNVAAVLFVNLGCEMVDPDALGTEIRRTSPWKPVETVTVQEVGVLDAIATGVKTVGEMVRQAATFTRSAADVSALTLAVECGGSDATSGLAANPALGLAVDRLIDLGGSAVFSETSEATGTGPLLTRRIPDESVARKLLDKLDAARRTMLETLPEGEHFLASGNIEGGLSTLEEKSLGAICKAGSREIVEVLDYGYRQSRRGLAFMDGTAYDVISMTGMVAGGAQIVAFTTGRGTPVGFPLAPVIKITGNATTATRMRESVDIDVSSIIAGGCGVEGAGDRIFAEILAVANGEQVKAELLGFQDFGISTTSGSCAGR